MNFFAKGLKWATLCGMLMFFSLHADEEGFFPRESLPTLEGANKTENRIFFLTNPRSGTHWVMHILTHFLHRGIIHDKRWYKPSFVADQIDTIDLTLPFIYHAHVPCQFGVYNPKFYEDKLIVIVRDPIETFSRASDSFATTIERIKANFEFTLLGNLEYYESWPEENRYIFYYEDLISSPKEEITKLLAFLGEDNFDAVEDFIANIDQHKNSCISFYDKKYTSYTRGNSVDFHSKKLTSEQRQMLRDLIRNKDPFSWDKYLIRYN